MNACDPESLREVMTTYIDEMRLVFERHGGTIEKIIGDAIVAVFGLPNPAEDDALRAVEAAAESLRAMAILNDQLEERWGVRLIVRTGVASGDVVVGEASAGQHVLTGPHGGNRDGHGAERAGAGGSARRIDLRGRPRCHRGRSRWIDR